MIIDCLDPLGINGYERKANDILAKYLPDSWKAYSSLEMIGRQSRDFEADLILITDDRIIVVELKNYKGKIFSVDGKWVQQYEDGYQENRKNGVHQARRAAQILSSKLDEKFIGKFRPWVDYCVVLCGSATQSDLPNEEQGYVFTLEQFKEIGDEKIYIKYFGNKKTIKRKEDAPNKNITIWDRIFSNNSADFKAKTFSINNYIQKDTNSLLTHKQGLYSEFRSERADNHNYKAIMRRWDFTVPCIQEYARTPDQRALIAHRESSVLGYINSQNEDLKDIHLQLLHLPKDLTSDFVELYEWPNKKERLDVFIRKNKSKLTKQNRLDLIQSLISQLARLHDIDVAHRDISSHSIWVSLPSKVVLSNFLTAYYPDPENKTVSNVRKILQQGQVETPEELFNENSGTVYTRDVYLAIAACHYIAFDHWPQRQENIFIWEPIENNEISKKLAHWFEKGLELDSCSRFQNLRAALSELNKILDVTENDCPLTLLSKYYSTKNIFIDYNASLIHSFGNCQLLRSNDNEFAIKAWFGVTDTNLSGGINHQLLSFFNRLDMLQSASLTCAPKIMDYGLNPTMTCLYFQYEWVDGNTWDKYIHNTNKDDALNISKKLLEAVIELHHSNIHHGDIQPKNIIIEEDKVFLIDFLDFNNGNEKKYTPAYVPQNFEALSLTSIDRYAVIKLINEIATEFEYVHLNSYTNNILSIPEISSTEIENLYECFDSIVEPPKPIAIDSYFISHKSLSNEEIILSDDGIYYATISINSGKNKDLLKVRITGVRSQIELSFHPEKKFIAHVSLKSIQHDQFIRSKRDAELEIKGCITLNNNLTNSNEVFIDHILNTDFYAKIVEDTKDTLINDTQPRPILSLSKFNKPNIIPAKNIWRALVETEHESNPKIQVITEPKFTEQGQMTFRYTVEDTKFDFDLLSERVSLKISVKDEIKYIGSLQDYNSDTIIFKPKGRINIQIGDTVMLEGSMTAASLAKREKAVANLIRGRSVIPNITDYFSPGLIAKHYEGNEPSDEELDFYTEVDDQGKVIFSLNEQQRAAFKKLYKFGPISLLQGPPGTGKTAFIGSYIHYSILQGARRVLLVSQSHEAVNNATEKARALFSKNNSSIDIVRFGDQNNLSIPLDDISEKSLQEHYRDKFRAEYKERVLLLTNDLGIDKDFSVSITNFEVSFGNKLEQLSSLIKDPELANSDNVANRIKITIERLTTYLERDVGISIKLEGIQLSKLREKIYKDIASHFGVYSDDTVYKLKNIIDISNEWLSVMASSQSQFQNFLAKTRTLVSGTCVGIGRYHYGIQENIYDLVVIDEAARSPASELAIAMQVGRKILLVGDHKQLPPLFDEHHIKAAKRLLPEISVDELKRSDFERAFVSDYGKKIGCSLLIQYRMAPVIGNLVSSCFYENKLQTGRSKTKDSYYKILNNFARPVTWFDTSEAKEKSYEQRPQGKGINSKSWVNSFEADKIIAIIKYLYDNDTEETILTEGDDPKIGVICMYGEQVRLLVKKINSLSWARNLLEKRIIKIDTVDSYQGKENDIIILSLVRSNRKGEQGYVSSENRANVSLSRAREALFIVGNKNMWQQKNFDSAFGKVFAYISSVESDEYTVLNANDME